MRKIASGVWQWFLLKTEHMPGQLFALVLVLLFAWSFVLLILGVYAAAYLWQWLFK